MGLFDSNFVGNKVSSILGVLTGNDERTPIFTRENVDCSSVSNIYATKLKALMNGRKYLKLSFTFNQVDASAQLYVEPYRKGYSGETFIPCIINEAGIYQTEYIKPSSDAFLSRDYYLVNMTDSLKIRVNAAGASGLTCTINIYATDFCPTPLHIQPIETVTLSNSTSEQTKRFSLNYTLMQNYKFMYVELKSNTTAISGSITKSWNVLDENDAQVETFADKTHVVTKWYPVNALDGNLIVRFTGASAANNTRVTIYGVC